MFEGLDTGRVDGNGVPLICGASVLVVDVIPSHTVTTDEDGWGRTVQLQRIDWVNVPEQTLKTSARLAYDPAWAAFVVQFDDYLPGTGIKQELLYVALKRQRGGVFVVA